MKWGVERWGEADCTCCSICFKGAGTYEKKTQGVIEERREIRQVCMMSMGLPAELSVSHRQQDIPRKKWSGWSRNEAPRQTWAFSI